MSADAKENLDSEDIVLHMFPRSMYSYALPNLSPFAIKLETWLRLKKLPYKIVETTNTAKKSGLTPFIIYKGEEVSDSSIIMEFLSHKYGHDLYEGYDRTLCSVGRAFSKMVDENTVWTISHYRFNEGIEHSKKLVKLPAPGFLQGLAIAMVARNFRSRAQGHGIGRRSSDEIYQIGEDDIRAISGFLGRKPFFLGDRPAPVDCSIFGQLAEIYYVDFPSPHKTVIEKELTNIGPYLDRIKHICWPDWDEICKEPPPAEK